MIFVQIHMLLDGILYYCTINNIMVNSNIINKTDVSEHSKISEVTINKCYKKLLENKKLIS